MRHSPNRYYRMDIIIRDSEPDTDKIYDDVEHLLGGYDVLELDIYEINRPNV